MKNNVFQYTLVIFKPDVVQRQIIGEFITRFERKGYKIIGMKMIHPTKDLVSKHYSDDSVYLTGVGEKAIISAKERGEDVNSKSALEIGKQVREWNIEYLSCGPVIALVFEGAHVVEAVRKVVGKTNPILADVGTIRADYSPDSFTLADMQGRTTRTLIHASDSVESAEREIPLWFSKEELCSYTTAIEHILYDTDWTRSTHNK